MIEFAPISQREARAWINNHHRHLNAPRGDVFRVALITEGEIVAVACAGRPVARAYQDGRTLEITRVASAATASVNANSRLYATLVRAGRALGYRCFVTYTLPRESGISLRASGFRDDGMTRGGEWSRVTRPRNPAEQAQPKRRWIYDPRPVRSNA